MTGLSDVAKWGVAPSASSAAQSRDSAQSAYEETVYSARQSVMEDYGAILERQQQEHTSAAYSASEIARRAGQAAGNQLAQLGGVGQSGNTVVALLSDIHRQRLGQEQSLLYSQQARDLQAAREGRGIQMNAYQTILQAFSRVPAKSTIFQGGLQDTQNWLKILQMGGAFSPSKEEQK